MKKIAICGSMKIKDKILKIGNNLENLGYEVLYPTECMEGKSKNIASRAHFDRICDDRTDIVLIINERAHNMDNYIGPNSFAEIAFGFYFKKRVYLLNDYYEPYLDELTGWGIKTLNGNIKEIK